MRSHNFIAALMVSTIMVAPVSAFAQDAAANDAAAPEDEAEIVVTGLRESLKSSAQIKRNSLEIVESIQATDIGKLPDANVAETLSRVPGVQSYRFGGESASPVGNGSGLTIRGLSGQTGSRVDGRAYFTAGGREFNVEGASPGMVAGIDVYKNPSAEHIEGAIGGLVNIRTRKPFDFDGFAGSVAVGGLYNDLGKKFEPNYFGMISNRFDVGDGELGILLAANYSRSFNRGDNTPAVSGTQFRRAILANSAEYAANVGTGLGLNPAYVGRADITYLATVDPTTVAPTSRGLLISSTAVQNSINQEGYERTRKGLSGALQWRPDPTLELYVEGNYNSYLYHQNYRFLSAADSRYARGLTLNTFTIDEALANRNANGSTNDQLSGLRIAGGTFLGSSFTSTGGDEHRLYETYIVATGVKWRAADNLFVDLDLSYIKADQYQDNRSVTMLPAAGLTWDITRTLGAPQQVTISGPDLSLPGTWVLNQYANGTNQVWDDSGVTATLDINYKPDGSFLTALKAGVRFATQKDAYSNFAFSGRNLTTNGAALAANQSNGISATSVTDLVQTSPTNFMGGAAGYAGGFLVFSPDALLGNNVAARFPLAGILPEDALAENVLSRRFLREKTYAGYAQAEFALLDEAVTGTAGVRIVKTDTFTRAMVQLPGSTNIVSNEQSSSYTDVLPSFNLTGHISDRTLVRFGYSKGITRPDLGLLNPAIILNQVNGTGTVGNPALKPQKADSFDLSLEHYFTPSNYVALGLFSKKIDGFFSGVASCQTIAGAPTPTTNTSCTGNQYFVTQTTNAASGTAKGIELSGQTFFDYPFLPDFMHNFGVQGSFTYVDTVNPLVLNGVAVDTPQPMTSKYAYSLTGMYEDDVISARIVYTWRSEAVLFGVSANPIDGRYIQAFGLLDASLNINLTDKFSLSLTAANLLNAAPNRYVGELGSETGIQRQHFVNGRNFGATLRFKFGS
jgi:iron complex outermembrane receptor protein